MYTATSDYNRLNTSLKQIHDKQTQHKATRYCLWMDTC